MKNIFLEIKVPRYVKFSTKRSSEIKAAKYIEDDVFEIKKIENVDEAIFFNLQKNKDIIFHGQNKFDKLYFLENFLYKRSKVFKTEKEAISFAINYIDDLIRSGKFNENRLLSSNYANIAGCIEKKRISNKMPKGAVILNDSKDNMTDMINRTLKNMFIFENSIFLKTYEPVIYLSERGIGDKKYFLGISYHNTIPIYNESFFKKININDYSEAIEVSRDIKMNEDVVDKFKESYSNIEIYNRSYFKFNGLEFEMRIEIEKFLKHMKNIFIDYDNIEPDILKIYQEIRVKSSAMPCNENFSITDIMELKNKMMFLLEYLNNEFWYFSGSSNMGISKKHLNEAIMKSSKRVEMIQSEIDIENI